MQTQSYWRYATDNRLLYAKLVVKGAERVGIKGRKLLRVAKLARETSWLIGIEQRGSNPHALASAALYWVWLLEFLRGNIGAPRAEQCWKIAESSRPSFYRAISIWAKRLLNYSSSRPLLKLRVRLLSNVNLHELMLTSSTRHLICVERDGYSVIPSMPWTMKADTTTCDVLLVVP